MSDLDQIRHSRLQAMVAFEEGHLPDAESDLDQLIELLAPPNTPQERAELFNLHSDRATVRRFANRWEDTLKDLEICDRLISQMGPLWQRLSGANIAFLRAKIHSNPHIPVYDPEKAKEALIIVRQAEAFDFACDEIEAGLAFLTGDWEKAAELSLTASRKLEEQGWLRAAASCRRLAADAYMESGELFQAEKQISAAHEYLKKHGAPGDQSRSLLSCARLKSFKGEHDVAWELLLEGLAKLDFLIRRFTVLSEQQRFLIDKLESYQRAFEIALAKTGPDGCIRAWTIVERSKSFYLCQLLASADVRLFDGLNPDELSRLKELEERVDSCERKLARLSDADSESDQGRLVLSKMQDLYTEKQHQIERMMKENPKWARLNNPSFLNLKTAIERLPQGWVLLSYYWQSKKSDPGSNLHIFWLDSKGNPRHIYTEWTDDQISQLVQFQGNLRGDVDIFDQVFPDHLANKVFPSELYESLPKDSRILISPHGPLQMLPLHAVRLHHGDFVIERWPIQYIPSFALLPTHRSENHKEEILLVGCEQDDFGDPPLADITTELVVLEELWSGKRPGCVTRRIITSEKSLESNGIGPETWHRYDKIHIACHGIFPDKQPFDAALRLGSDAVRASEFFLIRLNANLLILSACALGRQAVHFEEQIVIGDEWIGLILPLLYAGARCVVASLWNANSGEAKSIMERMHRFLTDGLEPADALRATQKVAQKSSFTSQWSNWIVVGLPHNN